MISCRSDLFKKFNPKKLMADRDAFLQTLRKVAPAMTTVVFPDEPKLQLGFRGRVFEVSFEPAGILVSSNGMKTRKIDGPQDFADYVQRNTLT